MKLLDLNTPLGQAFRNFIHQFIDARIDTTVFAKLVDDSLTRNHNGKYERQEGFEIHLTSNGVRYHSVEHFIEFEKPEDEIAFILKWS